MMFLPFRRIPKYTFPQDGISLARPWKKKEPFRLTQIAWPEPVSLYRIGNFPAVMPLGGGVIARRPGLEKVAGTLRAVRWKLSAL
jgi:hypothetical protein